MTDYLALLKVRSGKKRIPDEPPKLTKPGFVGFDSDLGVHILQATSAAAIVSDPPSSAVIARTDTEPTNVGKHSVADWTEAHEERAAIVEFDGGAPRAWGEALARLDPNKPPGDVPLWRWLRFIDDCGRFLNAGCAERAAALGWGPLDLFGCDRERPFARIDHMGLLWLVNGGIVVELHRDRAILESERGARQSYRRRPVEVGRVVLAWEGT